jgi:hypothetical protein
VPTSTPRQPGETSTRPQTSVLAVGVEYRLCRKTKRTRSVKGAPAINRQRDPGHERRFIRH